MNFNELLVQFFSVLQRRKVLFLVLFFATFFGAVGGAYVKPAWFESTATLMVTLHSSRVSTTPSDQQQMAASLQPEEIMAAQVEIMVAREVTEELVDVLPEWVFVKEPSKKWYVRLILNPLKNLVEFITSLLERARLIEPENQRYTRIQTIEKGLTVFPVRKAQVIEITFRSKDPRVPPVVIDALIKIYKERANAMRADAQGVELYHDRALLLSEQLAAAEQERADFMLANGIVDFEGEKLQLMERIKTRRLRAEEERLTVLVGLEPELNQLNRKVAILSDTYRAYQQAADDRDTFLERDNDISAQVIDAPSVIYSPYTRSRLVLVLIGFVAALILAAILVHILEWTARIRALYKSAAPQTFVQKPTEVETRLKAAE